MPEATGQYAVINTADDIAFFRQVADALVQACEMHRIDAIQRAKDRPFIFHTNCSQHQAQALKSALAAQDVPAAGVPMEYFTELGAARPLHNANCLAEYFEVEPLTGETVKIPWQDVAMIGYGRVEHRERKIKGASGGPDAMGSAAGLAGAALGTYVGPNPAALAGIGVPRRIKPKLDISGKERVSVHDCLDIFVGYLEDDEFAGHFRVLADSFYYDYLGESIQPTSKANFRLFVGDIVHYVPGVLRTEKTRQFLDGRPPGKPLKGFPLFDEYNRWSVAISRVTGREA